MFSFRIGYEKSIAMLLYSYSYYGFILDSIILRFQSNYWYSNYWFSKMDSIKLFVYSNLRTHQPCVDVFSIPFRFSSKSWLGGSMGPIADFWTLGLFAAAYWMLYVLWLSWTICPYPFPCVGTSIKFEIQYLCLMLGDCYIFRSSMLISLLCFHSFSYSM